MQRDEELQMYAIHSDVTKRLYCQRDFIAILQANV